METTKRLYYTDCALREFEAQVLRVEPDPARTRVYLDQTAFYPDSGGQPSDRGTLGGIPILDVLDEGEAIVHILERKPEGVTLRGVIDWVRRFDHMQQHTGQHVLSGAFERTGEYKTVSFHMGSETSTIDLDSDRASPRQMDEAETLANQVVFEDRPVRIFFRSAAEASRMNLRKPAAREGDVRVVEIEDFDLSACGGTHVGRTGAIGLIQVRKFERTRGRMRVEFVCGGRALSAARRDFRLLSEAARIFSASLDSVPALIKRHETEMRETMRRQAELTETLAGYRARELWEKAPERNGVRILRHIFPSEEHDLAKMVAHAISALPSCIGLIGVLGSQARVYFAQSSGGRHDMVSLLKQAVSRLGGKGGGTRDFSQGGGVDEQKLEEALKFAESLISNSP